MKKYLITSLLIIIIIPSVAVASWWNPFSWKIFQRKELVKIETPSIDIDAEIKARVDEQVEATLKARVDEEVKINQQKSEEQKRIDAAVKTALDKQKAQSQQQIATPVSKPLATQPPLPSITSTEKNYYINTKSRVKELIGIYESYEIFLQDTSNQLRSASLTLAGYNLGGLYGQSRDAAIDLANASIEVNNKMMTNTKKSISYFESILDFLNNDPEQFVDEETFNKIQTPESLNRELDGIMEDTNSSLESVMNALKYH